MNEKQIAQQAKNKLHNAVMQNISRMFKTSNQPKGMLTTKVKPRFNKQNQLLSLSVSGPKHLYVQNYGFEGRKSTGIMVRLKATSVVDNAIESSGVVEFLAQAIGEARAEEIVAKIKG